MDGAYTCIDPWTCDERFVFRKFDWQGGRETKKKRVCFRIIPEIEITEMFISICTLTLFVGRAMGLDGSSCWFDVGY
jgi:hypothetical protein